MSYRDPPKDEFVIVYGNLFMPPSNVDPFDAYVSALSFGVAVVLVMIIVGLLW